MYSWACEYVYWHMHGCVYAYGYWYMHGYVYGNVYGYVYGYVHRDVLHSAMDKCMHLQMCMRASTCIGIEMCTHMRMHMRMRTCTGNAHAYVQGYTQLLDHCARARG